MRATRYFFFALISLGISHASATGQERLAPSEVVFATPALTLNEALAQLQKQTGNPIRDERSSAANPRITLGQQKYAFWQALDAIAKEANVTYTTAGGITLVDRPYRAARVHYSGPFRFAFKRISVNRDEDTRTRLCNVAFDVAWEPRVRLLFFNFEGGESAFRRDTQGAVVKNKLEAQAAQKVSGRGSAELELSFPAPDRKVTHLDLVQGNIKILGASKVLEFQIAKLDGLTHAEQEGVKVRAKLTGKSSTRWDVTLEVEHPAGALPKLQSFEEAQLQEFIHQRVWLAWNGGEQEKTSEEELASGKGIKVHFVFKKGQAPPKDATVTLHFRTPNRVTYFAAPFEFKDLALP